MRRRSKFLAAVLAILVAVGPAIPASAWNDRGHMLVARIAYQQLSPAERAKVIAVLREHPHYRDYMAKTPPEGFSEEEWVFVRAATWSDWVRPPRGFKGDVAAHPRYKFHRGPWHYVNYPVKLPITDVKLPAEALKAETSIEQELPRSFEIARGADVADPGVAAGVEAKQNRAVRLAWLFHFVGDIHQPLHTTALVDKQLFKTGSHADEGGNLLAVRPAADQAPIRLHSYWDGVLGRESLMLSVGPAADQLRTKYPADSFGDQARNLSVRDWIAESYADACRSAYLNGKLPLVPWSKFEDKQVSASDVPAFTAADDEAARTVATKRVLLAGYRLAEMLKKLP